MKNILVLIKEFNKSNNFEPILEYYKSYIKYLSRRFKIEEYLSSLFIKLWKVIKEIKLNKFENENSIDFFIKRCLKNYSINVFRKYVADTRIVYNDEILNIEANKVSNSTEMEILSEINFYDIIKKLSAVQNRILVLRYRECFSDREIAEVLGISRQAVYKNRKCALEILKYNLL